MSFSLVDFWMTEYFSSLFWVESVDLNRCSQGYSVLVKCVCVCVCVCVRGGRVEEGLLFVFKGS